MVVRIVLTKKSRKRLFHFGFGFCESASFGIGVNRTECFRVFQNVRACLGLPIRIRHSVLWVLAAVDKIDGILGVPILLFLCKQLFYRLWRDLGGLLNVLSVLLSSGLSLCPTVGQSLVDSFQGSWRCLLSLANQFVELLLALGRGTALLSEGRAGG